MPSNRSLLWIALAGAALIAVLYYFGMSHASAPAAPAGPTASTPAAPASRAAMSEPAPADLTAAADQQDDQQDTEKPKLPLDGEWVDAPSEKSDQKPEQKN